MESFHLIDAALRSESKVTLTVDPHAARDADDQEPQLAADIVMTSVVVGLEPY